MKNKKINIKMSEDEKQIIFLFDDDKNIEQEIKINIEEENENNLNELYDHIIQNIDEIELIDEIDGNKDGTVYLAAKELIKLLENEIQNIREDRKSFRPEHKVE